MSLRDFLNGLAPPVTLASNLNGLSTANERMLRTVSVYERELWMVAVGAMLVDVTLTVHGLQLGLKELNPIGRTLLDSAGVLGLYALKAIALGMGVGCAILIPDRYTGLVPLGLAIPSLAAVIVNSVVISVTLF